LVKFRPAAASDALRERLRAQRSRKVVSFRRWEMASIAAVAASVVFGVFTMFRHPVADTSVVKVGSPVSEPSQRLLSVHEIGLIRRGVEPPVQLLAVEDVTIASASANPTGKPKVEISTRIVPVVLEYY
jgi:hypothetical protein